MKKFSAEEIKAVLAEHRKWRQSGGTEGSRANLARANLAGANLARANLAGADLAGANLAGADLARAYLAGAYLADAYLAGAYLADADLADADLAGADLADADLAGANLAGANLAGADLAGADLAGAYLARAYLAGADLAGAYLAGALNVPGGVEKVDPPTPYVRANAANWAEIAAHYRLRHPEIPVVENLDAKILEAVTIGGGKLEMSSVHVCETTHCRAGWAVTLAGEDGKKLESELGWQRAASMIYRASTGRVPHFYASNERALEDLRECAAARAPGVEV